MDGIYCSTRIVNNNVELFDVRLLLVCVCADDCGWVCAPASLLAIQFADLFTALLNSPPPPPPSRLLVVQPADKLIGHFTAVFIS